MFLHLGYKDISCGNIVKSINWSQILRMWISVPILAGQEILGKLLNPSVPQGVTLWIKGK